MDIFIDYHNCLLINNLMGTKLFCFVPLGSVQRWEVLRGVTFCRFHFGMLPTQCSHYPLLYLLTAALFPVLGHPPILLFFKRLPFYMNVLIHVKVPKECSKGPLRTNFYRQKELKILLLVIFACAEAET